MSKEVATTKTAEETAVTTTATAALPAFMAERAAQDVGKGTSQAADDNIVPLVYVLQAQSPQCNRRGPDYVEGAEAGAFWLRGSGLPAVSGDEGILVQPVYFSKDWVEWLPNRGGYAGRHLDRPEDAVETEQDDGQGGKKLVWLRPNGNAVVETRYHVVIIHLPSGDRLPYVIPLSGSGHTVSKGWMTRMNGKNIPGVDGPAPSFSCLYRLKTKERSNAKGTWMTIDIIDAGWVQTTEDYERGAKLNESFAAGEKGIDVPLEQNADGGAGSSAAKGENAAM